MKASNGSEEPGSGAVTGPYDARRPGGRPKLVFIGGSLPFPVDSGAHVRAFHTLRLLSGYFDITAFFFYRRAIRKDASAVQMGIEGLQSFARVRAFPIPQENSRVRFLFDHLRSVLLRRSYGVFTYESAALHRALEVVRKESIDVLHLDSLDLSGYLEEFSGKTPVVCSHHNVESELLRRRSELSRNWLRRKYLQLQARFVEAEERRWVPRLSLNIVVSENDERTFREMAPSARLVEIPNCVDTSYLKPERRRRRGLVFIGGYSWHPNRDAMERFCDDILPLIREEEPDYPVVWLAREPPEACRRLSDRYAIKVVGFVEDVRPWILASACYVVPLRIGGGTRVKIVEAWALGSAVVSTTLGAEGLRAEDDMNILLADSPEHFADSVVRLIRSPELQNRIGAAARRTAESYYDWDAYGPCLIEEYRRLLA